MSTETCSYRNCDKASTWHFVTNGAQVTADLQVVTVTSEFNTCSKHRRNYVGECLSTGQDITEARKVA